MGLVETNLSVGCMPKPILQEGPIDVNAPTETLFNTLEADTYVYLPSMEFSTTQCS